MTWTAEQVTDLVAKSGILKKPLPLDAIAALMAKGTILKYPKGTLILQRGEQQPRFFLLLTGSARLVAHTAAGREFVSIFIQPGNFWGVHPCLDEVTESHDALADTDVEVLAVPAKKLRDLMWENRDFQEALVGFLCARLRMAIQVAEQFATWPPKARLAWRILSMAESHGTENHAVDETEISVSQESLASMINLSRQRTNKLLKEMERDNLLKLEYNRILITDHIAVKACFDGLFNE